ncbi:ATP-binding protein [Weeksellaceae bacterium TAE3-ERU29]|nr:ATP-binding protein [Weeksellaceae bacterium TAE3-ERU29]
MSYSENTQNLINKIIEIVEEKSEGLHYFVSLSKKLPEDSTEIKLTNSSSFFVQNKIQNFEEVKDTLDFRKQIIFRDNKEVLKDFPSIYIFQNKEDKDDFELSLGKEKKAKNGETIFKAQKPKYSLDRVILPKEVKEEIELSLTLIEYQKHIYDYWGFSEVDAKPKLILNFYGPPGTGKTMVSQAIANELGQNILAVNYAEIESKYVGDAPKNLFKAFRVAEEEKAVLFFDEADSFLGKRIENVSNSSDQAVNSLRSQMLILLEDFEGVVIFATNLVKNYDKAFESRILKHIHFDLPTKEVREKIIFSTIPSGVPFSEEVDKDNLCKELAEISEGFSGRDIKNAVLESLTIAVKEDKDRVKSSAFTKGFESTKDKLQKLEEERGKGKISKEFKEKIQSKIKENLEKEKSEKV